MNKLTTEYCSKCIHNKMKQPEVKEELEQLTPCGTCDGISNLLYAEMLTCQWTIEDVDPLYNLRAYSCRNIDLSPEMKEMLKQNAKQKGNN